MAADEPKIPQDKDIANTIAGINDIGNAGDGLTSIFNGLKKNIIDIGTEGVKHLGDIGKLTKESIEYFGSLGDKLGDVINATKDMGDNFNDAGQIGVGAIDGVSESLDHLLVDIGRAASTVSWAKMFEGADAGGASINVVSGSLTKLVNTFNGIIPGDALKAITGQLASLGDHFIENAGQAEKLENMYVSLQGAAGNMGELFEKDGRTLVDLASKTKNYTNQVLAVAGATGQSWENTLKMSNELKKLPGYFDQTINTGKGAESQLHVLQSTMNLMTGAGISQIETMKILGEAYNTLGQATGKLTNQAQAGAEFLADVSSVANKLGVQFDQVLPSMNTIAETFRFIGNESDEGAKFLTKYTDALRETGLTGKASMEIVDGMTKSIHDMTIGTKAFLSLRSGGPGGLQGSFQIDQLLREGKLDQVAQMAEKAMRQQFGGRIYTQAEAASSPQAAAQFMRQRSLLKSGAFGIGQGASDEQATRLLEALGKRDFGAISKELKTGTGAVGEVSGRGQAIEERNNTELKKMNLAVARAAVAAEITAGIQMKQFFGTSGANKADILTNMGKSSIYSNQFNSMSKTATTKEEYQKEEAISQRQTVEQIYKSIGGIVDGIANAGNEIKSGTEQTIDDIKGVLGIAKQNPEDKVMDNTIKQPHRTLMQPDKPSQNVLKIPDTTVISAKYNPQGSSSRMPTVAEASRDPKMAEQRKRMMQESHDRKSNLYTDAVHKAGYNQHAPTTATAATKEALKSQEETKQLPPQKVILEISAPPGFNVHKKSGPNSIEVMNGAAAGTNNGKSSDPGY